MSDLEDSVGDEDVEVGSPVPGEAMPFPRPLAEVIRGTRGAVNQNIGPEAGSLAPGLPNEPDGFPESDD